MYIFGVGRRVRMKLLRGKDWYLWASWAEILQLRTFHLSVEIVWEGFPRVQDGMSCPGLFNIAKQHWNNRHPTHPFKYTWTIIDQSLSLLETTILTQIVQELQQLGRMILLGWSTARPNNKRPCSSGHWRGQDALLWYDPPGRFPGHSFGVPILLQRCSGLKQWSSDWLESQ